MQAWRERYRRAVRWQLERVPYTPTERWSARVGSHVLISIFALALFLTPLEVVLRGPLDPRTLICAALSAICGIGLAITRTTGRAQLSSAVTHTLFTAVFLACYPYVDPTLAVLIGLMTGLDAILLAGNAIGWAVLLTFTSTYVVHRGLPAYLDGEHERLVAVAITTALCLVFGGIVTLVSDHQTRTLETRDKRRRALEDALAHAEEANALKSSFLANTSHEVRTPMNGVLGLLEVMGRTDLTTDQRMLLQTARRSAVGLLGILDGILDLSKLDAGEFQLQPEPSNIGHIVKDAAQLLANRARKGVEVKAIVGEEVPPWLMLDGLRMRQVVMNLVSNAVKFTAEGRVQIEVMFAEQQLVLCVSDTGIGMTPEQLTRVFDPFQQADSSTSRTYGGTGLGLTISRRLVELMDGHLSATSSVGRGATFQVTVPAHPCKPPTSAAPEFADHVLHVLVVDDDPVNRLVAQRMIETAGHRVDVANDGAAGVQAASTHAYDLVLMDRQMPRMDGIEATRAIRELPGPASEVPIVALTASAMVDDQQQCLEAGMDAVLTKPYTLDQMSTLIATIAAKRALAV